MAESISGRLRTLLGNKSAAPDERPAVESGPDEPEPVATHYPPFISKSALPPDVAVRRDDGTMRHDAPVGDAPFTDVPPTTPPLPTDLSGAHAYQAELQSKMTALAEDFSLGKINRRQFEAVYTHYREQRQIIDALINSLNVDTWRRVVSEGHTGMLLSHNAAQLIGYAVYDQASRLPMTTSPSFKIDPARVAPLIEAHHASRDVTTRISLNEISGGRWLCLVPGQYTTLVALFSVEPARAQLQLLQDLHHDFELANAKRLRQGRGHEVAEQFMQLWSLEQAI
jgi:hypothetical protein